MTTDLSKCAPAPVVPAVTQLPRTGLADVIGGGVGLSSIAGTLYYYRDSRKYLAKMFK